jgi:hypothetical protein
VLRWIVRGDLCSVMCQRTRTFIAFIKLMTLWIKGLGTFFRKTFPPYCNSLRTISPNRHLFKNIFPRVTFNQKYNSPKSNLQESDISQYHISSFHIFPHCIFDKFILIFSLPFNKIPPRSALISSATPNPPDPQISYVIYFESKSSWSFWKCVHLLMFFLTLLAVGQSEVVFSQSSCLCV